MPGIEPGTSFILAATFVDALALLSTTKSDERAWDEFAPVFLPAYKAEAENLYRSYRSKLSHQYSLEGFRLVDGEDYRHRHWTFEEGERVLHLESVIEDLEQAWSAFSARLNRDAQFRERVLERARDVPPLSVQESAAGTTPVASPATLSARAGGTHFGPMPFVKWEPNDPSEPKDQS